MRFPSTLRAVTTVHPQVPIRAGDAYYHDFLFRDAENFPVPTTSTYEALIVSVHGTDSGISATATVIDAPDGRIRVTITKEDTTSLYTVLRNGMIRIRDTDLDVTLLEYEYVVTP